MSIEDLSLDEMMGGLACQLLDPVYDLFIHGEAAELIQDLVVVDFFVACA